MKSRLEQAYELLLDRFGPQRWWPGDTPFEVIVGAMLTQNTNWTNVERAIENLREAGVLDPLAMHRLSVAELEELIRPAGYFRVKARRLRHLLDWLVERHGGSLDAMFAMPLAELREELLAVHGVGPETADSILLYAGKMPTFVIDAYTHRVAKRHGWIEEDADYYALKELFEGGVEADEAVYNEYHALLVRVGKLYCRKSVAKCDECPLAKLLPEGGPRDP